MPNIEFECPECRQPLQVDENVRTNDGLAGRLTYAAFGGSGSTFYNIEI